MSSLSYPFFALMFVRLPEILCRISNFGSRQICFFDCSIKTCYISCTPHWSFDIMPVRTCNKCLKSYASYQSHWNHKQRCIGSSGGPTIEQGKNFVSNQGVGSNHSHSQLDSQRVNMSLFPSDSQFERCVAATNESSNAVQWKDLTKNVIYRVKPQVWLKQHEVKILSSS